MNYLFIRRASHLIINIKSKGEKQSFLNSRNIDAKHALFDLRRNNFSLISLKVGSKF